MFLYLGFMVFLSLEDKLLSVEGSCIHLVPLILRLGSRAGGRLAAPGRLDRDPEAFVGFVLSDLLVVV